MTWPIPLLAITLFYQYRISHFDHAGITKRIFGDFDPEG